MTLLGGRITGQVTLGNLISAGTMILVAYGVYKDLSGTVVQHDRRLAVVETRVSNAEERLHKGDVTQAEIATQLTNLQDLLKEVRDQLRTSERGSRP